MSHGNDLEPFSESIDDVFRRLGIPHPELLAALSDEWDSLAGKPWAGRSKPLYVRGKTLVVEAASPSMVAFLKYGEPGLLTALQKRFGQTLIEQVEVLPPGRS